MDYKEILNTVGLAFNFFGTLLIIFYIRTDPNEWIENEGGKHGERWYSLFIKHPRWLYFGVILITIGFLLAFISSLLK